MKCPICKGKGHVYCFKRGQKVCPRCNGQCHIKR
jgi:hypothetical protein